MSRHRIYVAVGAAFAMAALAGCGGDETTTTTTVTQPGGDETTNVCDSKSAPNVTGLEATNMSCKEADALTGDVIQALSREPFTVGEFDCEIRGQSGPDTGAILGAEDITCTSGDRSFRFNFGD